MSKKNRRQTKPWSNKRRVGMAALMTGVILGCALLIGGGIYYIGLSQGWIESQSIRTKVYKELMSDPKVLQAVYNKGKERHCANQDLGLIITHDDRLQVLNPDGEAACTQFYLINSSGNKGRVVIRKLLMENQEAVNEVVTQLSEVVTDTFDHPLLDGVIIRGVRLDKNYLAILIYQSENETWIIDYDAVDPMTEKVVMDLVQEIMFVD